MSGKCCDVGTHGCSVLAVTFGNREFRNRVMSVDRCILAEVVSLWNRGIKTIGSCCGHGKADGYIQTEPEHLQEMLDLGYERVENELNAVHPAFIPKTCVHAEEGLE